MIPDFFKQADMMKCKSTNQGDKMKILNTEPAIMIFEKAQAMAVALQDGDDEWTYLVEGIHKGPNKGMAKLSVYDEEGFVGYWSETVLDSANIS